MTKHNQTSFTIVVLIFLIGLGWLAYLAIAPTPVKPIEVSHASLHINESKTIGATTFLVSAVTQDSRCPSDVTCIQAGKISANLQINNSSGVSSMEIEPGKAITVGMLTISLDDVMPHTSSGHKITDNEYVFVFTLTVR